MFSYIRVVEATQFWRIAHFIPFLETDSAYLARKKGFEKYKLDKILISFKCTFSQIWLIIESFYFQINSTSEA